MDFMKSLFQRPGWVGEPGKKDLFKDFFVYRD